MMWITLALALQLPDNSEALKKVEWLVGAWSGSGEMAEMGKYEESVLFEWTLKKNFLKITQVVRAQDAVMWHSTGLLGWDTSKKQFVWFQFGYDGTIGWVRTADDKVDGKIVMEGSLTGEGPFKSFRSTFKKTGDGAMNQHIEFKQGDAFSTFISTDFKKQEKLDAGKPIEAPDAGHLKGFEWMIGTWVGSSGNSEMEYRLGWAHSGNFIQNDFWMRVDGKEVWHDTGMIGWDVDKKKVVGLNFGIDGTIGWGEGEMPADPTSFRSEGETFGPTENIKFRATVRKIDADTIGSSVEKKDGDAWVPYMPEEKLKRKK